MRIATPIALLLLVAALLAGCGGDSDSGSSSSETASKSKAAPKQGGAKAPAGASAKNCESFATDAEDLRATGVSCTQARQLMFAWQRSKACAPPKGASRSACSLKGSYRCLAAGAGRGISVGCAKPGRSVAFLAVKDG